MPTSAATNGLGTEPARVSPSLRRGARGRLSRPAALDVAIAALAVLLIASPLLFTNDGFASDFTNAIWLANYQQHVIAAHLHPTLFMHTDQLGVFYPQFVFYGATLYALTGALAAALGGSTIVAFEIVTVAAIAAAYGGIFWLARQAGVKGLLAHVPALVFVTSAYYVTNLYGRGAWAEFIAVSALLLVLAASLRLVRGGSRFWPGACLVAATAVFSGSHNITLLWGSTLALLALCCFWLLSGRPRGLPWQRLLATAGLIALGVGLNGWFLLPDLSYAHDTQVSGNVIPWAETGFFNTFGVIFYPLRTVPRASTTPALYVQAPVLALAWALCAVPLVWRERRLRAGLATTLIALGAMLVLITSSGAWSLLPTIFRQIQFSYRLQTYVTLACATLVLLGALALTRRAESGRGSRVDRVLALGLGLAVAFGLALCAWQLWVPNTHNSESLWVRDDAVRGSSTHLPASWYGGNDFADRSLPIVAATEKFTFNPAAVADDRLGGLVSLPPGRQPFVTNIVGGPYLVNVAGGARVVGRAEGGELVLQRTKDGVGRVPVELTGRSSAPVVLGRIATALSAAALLALCLAAAARGRWRHAPARR
jgi:hypothetical protein